MAAPSRSLLSLRSANFDLPSRGRLRAAASSLCEANGNRMKSFSPSLAAHLASGATTLCACWRVTRGDGVVLGFTDHDRAIVFDDVEHEPETRARRFGPRSQTPGCRSEGSK